MNSEEAAIFAVLAGATAVTDKVAVYQGGPGIFAGEAPHDAQLPYVVFNQVATVPFDTLTEVGFDTLADVRCYTDRTGSLVELNELAEACRAALHRTRPAMAGRQTAGARVVSGPGALPVEENAVGKVMTLRIHSQEA